MREQIAYRRIPARTSAQPASRTYAGHSAGIHPEEDEDDTIYPTRPSSSAVRWTNTNGDQVIQQGNRRIIIHEEPPPKKRRSWSLFVSIGMMVMVLGWVGLSALGTWWTNHQLDAQYGFPRTWQTDAIVYAGDSADHPSHYIFLNLNGTVEIIELPHGDSQHARIYKGPSLFSDNADLIPITGEFKEVNGKVEMIVHIQDQRIIYVSDGTQFKPQQ